MIINDTPLEDLLKSLLQKNLKFGIKNKIIRKGKLILFKQNNYHIELSLQTKENNMKIFEIPIPFSFEEWKDDNLIYFDYRLLTLAHNKNDFYQFLKKLEPTNNKFYDNILEIQID